MGRELWLADLCTLLECAAFAGVRIFAVGGLVRDSLFDRGETAPELDVPDFDIAVEAKDSSFFTFVRGAFKQAQIAESQFFTCMVNFSDGRSLDLSLCRKDFYPRPGALPQVSLATLEQDALRRDFTINTLYVNLEHFVDWMRSGADGVALKQVLIDPCGGYADLESGRLEILHADSLLDDPTRIFRAARYFSLLQARHDRNISGEATLGPMLQQALASAYQRDVLELVSHFRKFSEMQRCFVSVQSQAALQELLKQGVFETWPPLQSEQRDVFRNWLHSLFKSEPAFLREFGLEVFKMCVCALVDFKRHPALLSDLHMSKAQRRIVAGLIAGTHAPQSHAQHAFAKLVHTDGGDGNALS